MALRRALMLLNIAIAAGAFYAVVVLAVFLMQSRLIYYPEIGRDVTTTPAAVGLAYEDVWLEAGDRVQLHGWFVPRADAKGVALILHGNAGSIALRLDWLVMFHRLGYASFIIDYRGYGRSTGTPTEEGTYEDARLAWNHLTQTRGYPGRDVVLLGESLGGPIAAYLAAREPARALILHSTFTSIPDIAAEVYPFLPVRWISRFRYDTQSHLREAACPVLVAHSPRDEIVAYSHGRRLYETARAPKAFIELAGGHNDGFIFRRREWVDALARFLARFEGRDQASPSSSAT